MFGLKFPARVLRVLDGDTIEVEVRRTIRLRLLDCWAPETRTTDLEEKARGILAKRLMMELAGDADVSVEVPIDEQGKFGDSMTFGRVLARVTLDDPPEWTFGKSDLSEIMVESGHATKEREE